MRESKGKTGTGISAVLGIAVFALIGWLAARQAVPVHSSFSVRKMGEKIEEMEKVEPAVEESAASDASGDGAETESGLIDTHRLERRDSEDVEREIRQARRLRKEREIIELYSTQREQFENGEVDIWSMFGDSFILGDSRSEGLTYYGFLTEDNVYAYRGANLRGALDGLDDIAFHAPWNLYFNYGTNDATGNWPTAAAFKEKYAEVIAAYREALPEADIYVCSILPVTPSAAAANPLLNNIPSYNQAIRELCEEQGYCFIDCGSLYTEHPDLYEPDGIHFTKSMNDYWARTVIRATIEDKIARSEAALAELEAEESDLPKTVKQEMAEKAAEARGS